MDQHDRSGMFQEEPLIRSGFFGGCFFERMGLIEKSEGYAPEVRERAVRLVFLHGERTRDAVERLVRVPRDIDNCGVRCGVRQLRITALLPKGFHEHRRLAMTNSVCNSGRDSTRPPGPATDRYRTVFV